MTALKMVLATGLVLIGACSGDSTGAVPVCSAASAVPVKMAVGAYVSIDPGTVAGCLTYAGPAPTGIPVTYRTAPRVPGA